VDDNPDATLAMSLVLQRSGHDIRTAASGSEAIALRESFAPEVAFIDVHLTDMDGYQLAERLREMPGGAAIRMIALTGYGTAADRQRALQAGFDEHAVKPMNAAQLARLMEAEE